MVTIWTVRTPSLHWARVLIGEGGGNREFGGGYPPPTHPPRGPGTTFEVPANFLVLRARKKSGNHLRPFQNSGAYVLDVFVGWQGGGMGVDWEAQKAQTENSVPKQQ